MSRRSCSDSKARFSGPSSRTRPRLTQLMSFRTALGFCRAFSSGYSRPYADPFKSYVS